MDEDPLDILGPHLAAILEQLVVFSVRREGFCAGEGRVGHALVACQGAWTGQGGGGERRGALVADASRHAVKPHVRGQGRVCAANRIGKMKG